MKTSLWLLCLGGSMFIVSACNTARQPEQVLRPTATIKDIMDSLVDPSADVLWDSVELIVNASGTEERAPRTDEEWANVRRHVIQLLEATNLLLMEGRRVANTGEKAENPEIELDPEQIEKLISADRVAWINLAHGLYDVSLMALQAIDAKNGQVLIDVGGKIDAACENCHLKYWYPDYKQGSLDEQRFKNAVGIERLGR